MDYQWLWQRFAKAQEGCCIGCGWCSSFLYIDKVIKYCYNNCVTKLTFM